MTNLYLLRHGSVKGNEEGRYIGRLDEELSELGHRQVKVLRESINIDFNKIISSPLKRCVQTADYFGNPMIDERLLELNFGIFEGKTYKELGEQYREEYKMWSLDYKNYKIPKGESLMDLFKRVEDFLTNINKDDGNILIVTSGGVIRCMLSLVLDSYDYFYKFQIDNCRLSTITLNEGYWYIKSLNGGV
ncbi:MAG: histidine phosphatase family protein [Clostridiales bacterium]|nr:histidine phosphatase family protein [Clostridiales bacterium]